MFDLEMPDGAYFSLSGLIRDDAGGQTRALLMRNRLFAEYTTIRPTVLTFDSGPVYPEVRKALRRAGQLVPGMRLLNLHEDLRIADLSGEPVVDARLDDISGYQQTTEIHPDGTLYRIRYVDRVTQTLQLTDYYRADGSRYLRAAETESMRKSIGYLLLNQDEQPVRSYRAVRELYRFWIRWIAPPDQRIFIISDSRFTLAHVVPFRSPRFHVMHLMHNVHTAMPRTWNAPFAPSYGPLLDGIRHLDGLVTLSNWQREDVIKRYGRTDNLFVVPNPVDIPARQDPPPPRRRKHFVAVSRLEHQKRLEDAVRIFARVLKQVPDATFDIYGSGVQRSLLQREIDDLGVGHAVRLRGYDPNARNELWTATGFVMTSRYEGYPLASLESMSHGCPVISYDIKYGPRDQISDGVDGFLIKEGDLDGFAERIVELCDSPGTVDRMSSAAYEKAGRHDYRAFLADWCRVLNTVVDQKNSRVDITGVKLSDERIEYQRAVPGVPTIIRRRVTPNAGRPRPFTVSGRLDISITGNKNRLAGARLELHAICDTTAAMAPVPVTFTRKGSVIRFDATVDPRSVFEALGPDSLNARLRLIFVCANFSWRKNLGRSAARPGPYEVSFGADNRVLLSHRTE